MDNRSEVKEFLTTRRARITPDVAGLPAFGGNRRVPGLRREEVALLSGMSVDYYTRLERGDLSGVSPGVLDSLARALHLDDAETAHLHDLAHAANTSPVARKPRKSTTTLRPSIQRLLDAITEAPAIIRNNYYDYVAANRLGRALYSPVFAEPAPNSARFAFFNPAAHDFYPDWDKVVQEFVAAMRGDAGRNPFDKRLTDLVGELATRSETFRTLWAAHDVRYHRTGVKRIHHPLVGDLELTYEAFELPADPGLQLSTFTAEPGSPSEDALTLLATWAATIKTPAEQAPPSSQRT
ncbi:helix-turn-helix transcriptional regulator [Microbacterium sp. ARD31]|jgi:transcriptional regulator with XRE-family HTH domain|uniref:helix-turn-helix transcriptional regulator n=1 Tax=unclassified Microbacterium TaxID=2609290 RepID=UPI00203FEBAB|nr:MULTISPECIES: helix-turn-helix transcriptional regulator [unclassified Microbacterium]MDT0187082.1 helix-turn-helix transcriptional regulator [Microbacterium sp. ARD31]